MRHIFVKAGMAMTREDDEVHASCQLAFRRPGEPSRDKVFFPSHGVRQLTA